jgi:hypothetical protein
MQNQLEKIQPVSDETTGEIKPERQYILGHLNKLLGDRYFWYIVFFTLILVLCSFAPYLTTLIGLKEQLGWESPYYVAAYRTIYLLCVAIAAWRFGIRNGIVTSLILALVVFLPYILDLREGYVLVDVGLVLLGFLVSWVLGRQGDLARLLFKSTAELQKQANQLKLEIAERMKAEKEIRTLSLAAIESLVFALEAKDKYSAGHSRRVAIIAVDIGKIMSLSADDLEDLRCGSLLHDVGKIAVDQLIQNKASKLTSDEYQHIMTHSQAGAGIVRPIVNSKVVEFIEHHHDYYNGGSLNQVVQGENIPLGARIIALADAFDAMTSNRPYRTAMPVTKANKEIQAYAGTQFDPAVVKAFLEIPSDEITAIIEKKGKKST